MDEVVFGRYRLVGLIGEGGMGKVFRARDSVIGRDVAIKVLPAELSGEPGYRERFRREAHTAARLSEPHIVPIYDTGEIEGQLYLVMPVINGTDLHGLLLREGPMSAPRAVHVIEQLAAALGAAHAVGLVHRDIKPSNALVGADDFTYLIDFGIAHDATAATKLTRTGMMVGTFAYMAPERFTSGAADSRADVYSLACVLFECLTGVQPYPGDSMEQQIAGHVALDPPKPSVANPGVPAGLDAVIATGLAKDPEQRFQSARELASAAVGALNGAAAPVVVGEPTRSVPAPDAGRAAPVNPVAGPAVRAPRPVKAAQVIGREKLGSLSKIGQGGQGVVYRAPNVKTKFAASMVYKEYKSAARAQIDFTALAAMPALVEESLSYAQAERLVSIAAWPCAIVEDAGTPTGFVMPAIPDEFLIPLTTVKGVSSATAEFQHLLNHPSVLAARGITLDDVQRYTLLREVASGLAFLHRHGVCVGDISPKNLLFSLTPHEAVYFIDCDAMRINGVSALPQVETPGWNVPAGEELATIYSDAYKLGLLALRLVTGDHDTTNPRHLPGDTAGQLRQIITDTLSKPPQQRPLPEAWTYVLGHAIEKAQLQQNNPAPAPTAPAAPPIPVVRSRATPHSAPPVRPSAPPPPAPARVTPVWVAPASTPTSSKTPLWVGLGAAAVIVVLIIAAVSLANSDHNPTTSAPGTTTTQAWPYPTSTFESTPTYTPPPDPETQLQQYRTQDRDYISAGFTDRWIPQLGSKSGVEPWTFDPEDNKLYPPQQILEEHEQLRRQFGARLLWSGDWTVWDKPIYWVTVVPITFSDAASVHSWCTSHGRDKFHCSAQIVSKTLGRDGTHG